MKPEDCTIDLYPSDLPKKFPAYVRWARTERGLSIEHLALKLGVNEDWVRGIEAGDFQPTRRIVSDVAWALQLPVMDLLALAKI